MCYQGGLMGSPIRGGWSVPLSCGIERDPYQGGIGLSWVEEAYHVGMLLLWGVKSILAWKNKEASS